MLRVTNINVFYGKAQALWDVSFQVKEGEIVALVGSNGAGKTTMLKTLSRLIWPASGTIEFNSTRVDTLPPHKVVGLGISHVPEGRKLFPFMTVLENLELGASVPQAKLKRRASLEWVFELLPRLAERRSQLAETLSGGEQQMLAIGRGLMSRPKLLLLDEPSLGLAPVLVEEVFNIIQRINSEGVTVFLVEQNVQQTLTFSNRGYVLENGKITMEGLGDRLLEDERIRQAYLGM